MGAFAFMEFFRMDGKLEKHDNLVKVRYGNQIEA